MFDVTPLKVALFLGVVLVVPGLIAVLLHPG